MLWRALQEGGLLSQVGTDRIAARVRLGGDPGEGKHVIVLNRQAIHKQFGLLFPGHTVQQLKLTDTGPGVTDTGPGVTDMPPEAEEADSRAF